MTPSSDATVTSVLVVDDDEGGRGLLCTAFAARGWTVFQAADGSDALEMARLHHPSVIVSDVLMPRMDGFRLCEEIRRDADVDQTVIVVYSGAYADEEDAQRALRLGADAFVPKPESFESVVKAADDTLRKRAMGVAAPSPGTTDVDSPEVLKAYNERLVRKLESKLVELERRSAELQQCMRILSDEVEVKDRLISATAGPMDTVPLVGIDAALSAELDSRARRIEELEAQLRRATFGKSAVLAEVSHDLKTPLNTIIGFTGILLQGLAGPLTDEQRRQLDMVSVAGGRLLTLVNDVVELARLESGQSVPRADDVDPRVVIERVVGELHPQADDKSVQLLMQLERDTPPIVTDPVRFERIVRILVASAVRATDEGSVTVHLGPAPGGILVAVQDTGSAIEEHDLPHVFDEFHEMRGGRITRLKGAGLGLAIARATTELLNGHLTAESSAPGGALFTLRLPLTAEGEHREVEGSAD